MIVRNGTLFHRIARVLYSLSGATVIVAIILATIPPQATLAGSDTWENPDGSESISFTTPDTYNSCSASSFSDTIFTTGVPNNYTLKGRVTVDYVVDSGRILLHQYDVDQQGDLTLTVSYPPVTTWPAHSNGTREIHVDISITVYDENGDKATWVGNFPGNIGPGHQWDVYCLGLPLPSATFTATSSPTDTSTPTDTPEGPTPTFTNTPEGPTATSTNTPEGPTPTFTNTPEGPTPTFTNTPEGPTPTFTNTPEGPTPTFTNTPEGPTPTFTNTPEGPTPTFTDTPQGPTPTLTNTPRSSRPTKTDTPQPSLTPTSSIPQPNLLDPKRVRLVEDNDGNGFASAGDVLEYSIAITNTGNADATGVTFQDNIETNITLVPGSVSTTHGTVVSGNSAGDTVVAVDIGTIGSGEEAVITFRVTVNPLPEGVCEVVNQSSLSGQNFTEVVSDNIDTSSPNDATTINVCQPAPTPTSTSETTPSAPQGGASPTPGVLIPVTGADLTGGPFQSAKTTLFGLGLFLLGAGVVFDTAGSKRVVNEDEVNEADE